MAERPGFGPADRFLALADASFDIATAEIFLPLVVEGQTEIIDADVRSDGVRLRAVIEAGRATVVSATPATWRLLVAAGWNQHRSVRVWSTGEALSDELAARLLEQSEEVWNLYGPTETTIWSSVARVVGGESVSLGEPVANTSLYVRNDAGENVGPEGEGVLHIGGAGLADGYRGAPGQTQRAFVDSRFEPGERLFRTGDRVRLSARGKLLFLGRADRQIKLNGYRIEPAEIESRLVQVANIAEAVVVRRRGSAGHAQLAAFALPARDGEGRGMAELSASLGRFLPGFLVPSQIYYLRALPMTTRGKVDLSVLEERPLAEIRARFGVDEEIASGPGVMRPASETIAVSGTLEGYRSLRVRQCSRSSAAC